MRVIVGSLLFNAGMYSVSAAMAIIGIPLLLAPPRIVLVYARIWCRFLMWWLWLTCGTRYAGAGMAAIPSGPVIIAAKHQSAWETFAFNLLFPGCAFVIKRELLAIPIVGWLMARAGNVPIDRKAGASALRSVLRDARKVLDAGRPVVIFPEGTRASIGSAIAYQHGIAALYSQLKVPVVPVALNSGVFWPRKAFWKKPGLIEVEAMPAIPPGLGRQEFMDRLRAAIEPATERLVRRAEHPPKG